MTALTPSFCLADSDGGPELSGLQVLGELGYTALVDPATGAVERLEHTLARLPVALVASGEHLSPALVDRLGSAGTRAVLGFGDRPLGFATTVVFDQTAATHVAVEHLARQGHRSIVAIMPDDPVFEWFRAGRQTGAEEAAAAHGMDLTVVECPLDHERLTVAVHELITSPRRPDAIVAYNDDYALLALRALLDAGVKVPDDMAVIGCDNLPVAELFTPRLTTVDVDMRLLGLRIADTLHQILATEARPAVIPVPTPTVVVRDSA